MADGIDSRALPEAVLDGLLDVADVATVPYSQVQARVLADPQEIGARRPEGVLQVDPRNGRRVLYSTRRGQRPHDTPAYVAAETDGAPCFVCQGHTTRVVDAAQLSSGRTFVNFNLYPVVYPAPAAGELPAVDPHRLGTGGGVAAGVHFVQWNGTRHEADLHNLSPADISIILGRAAALERAALHAVDTGMPETDDCDDGAHRGWFVYFKNKGRPVGGSVAHGHQQALHTNVQPRAIADDLAFQARQGVDFPAYILSTNPPLLSVKDYPGCRLLVPYFMARPLTVLIVGTDSSAAHLHTMGDGDRLGLAAAIRDVSSALHALMPAMGRPTAFNLAFHLGGAGWYLEVHPWTQETGGCERMGLWLSQDTPKESAARYRDVIE